MQKHNRYRKRYVFVYLLIDYLLIWQSWADDKLGMERNICNNKFVKRSCGYWFAKRSLAVCLRKEVGLTALEALQQLYNYEVLGLLLD